MYTRRSWIIIELLNFGMRRKIHTQVAKDADTFFWHKFERVQLLLVSSTLTLFLSTVSDFWRLNISFDWFFYIYSIFLLSLLLLLCDILMYVICVRWVMRRRIHSIPLHVSVINFLWLQTARSSWHFNWRTITHANMRIEFIWYFCNHFSNRTTTTGDLPARQQLL